MKIAQLAPLVESVPPKGYGGTELVTSLLTEALVARGHQVTLFAAGDSKTKAELVAVVPQSLRSSTNTPLRWWPAYDIQSLMALADRQDEFDIVHNHMGYQALPFLKALNCPAVTTNHNNIKDFCLPIYLAFADLSYVAISKSNRLLNYGDVLNYVATIYNGIEVGKFDIGPVQKENYLLFLGRVGADKGTADAIYIAQQLSLPLKIAGKVDDADRQYYREFVKPKLKGNIEYIGEANFEEKKKLLNYAKAAIYPVSFNEPFGLVMAESLAAGTPVLAFDRGAVAEVVADGETGIIGKDADEIVKRFPEIEDISVQTCRARAEMFSLEKMVDQYEALYKKLAPVAKDVVVA